jgi:aspartate/methionine/tyrosine aminotransferase
MRIPDRVRAIELPQFDLLNDVAWRAKAHGADVINLGQALPGFPPPPIAVDAFRRALDDPSAHVYSADAGIPELRRALAQALSTIAGAQIDSEREVIITAGGNQAFQLALTTLIDTGDEVILPAPYFLNHEMAVRSVGATPVEAPLSARDGFAATWTSIAPYVTPRTRAVVLVSPSNPTGAVIPQSELEAIADACADRGIVTIVDETYMHFVYDRPPESAAALAHWRRNVVIAGSFSKAFAITGWRCGYLIANEEAIGEALKIQDCMLICAPVPVQRAVAAALESEPAYPRRWLSELNERRTFLVGELSKTPELRPVPPAGGFFVMLGVEGCTDSRALAMQLIDSQHVVAIPGRYFGESGEGYLRLSYGAQPRATLAKACERIRDFIPRCVQTARQP